MKIAIIGHSHVAALKRAADLGAPPPGVSLRFFGSSGSVRPQLRLEGNRIVSGSRPTRQSYLLTAGIDHIDLDAFDAFAMIGFTFEIRAFLNIFRAHTRYEHAEFAPAMQIASRAALETVMADILAAAPGWDLGRAIRERTAKPVLMVPSPCPSEDILKRRSFRRFARTFDGPYPALVYEEFRTRAQAIADRGGFIYVPHAAELLARPALTKPEYGIGSGDVGWTPDSQGPKRRADEWHMNADYGRLVLDDVLAVAARSRDG